ncbi:MAG: AraC family transcriptional regulator [Saccharofermentanales bacterium]
MFEDLLPELVKSISNFTGSIPVVFKGIERQFAKGDTNPKANKHTFHELLYIKSGKAVFEIEGRTIHVQKGDTLVIRPEKYHIVRVDDGYVDMVVLYFGFRSRSDNSDLAYSDSSNLQESGVNMTTIENFLQFASGIEDSSTNAHEDSYSPYLTLKGKARQDISGIVERIVREGKNDDYGKELMMQFLAMELLVALSRGLREEWEENLRVKTGKAKELVTIAREYMVRNHDRDISVADAAAHVFLSQGYFTRAFRDMTGMSPINFLIQVRVDHACRLLAEGDFKVAGIARTVGFASPQRFNAAFRKHTGITPVEYRRNILKTGQTEDKL